MRPDPCFQEAVDLTEAVLDVEKPQPQQVMDLTETVLDTEKPQPQAANRVNVVFMA